MDDDKKYLQIFIAESIELLQSVSDDLLEIEEKGYDVNIINRLFRNLHTLKGGAALDGLEKISNLAHLLEDIFGIIRDKNIPITEKYIDIFFESTDKLKELIDGIEDNYEKIEINKLKEKLIEVKETLIPDLSKNISKLPSETSLTLSEKELKDLLRSNYNVYQVICKFNPSDSMRNVNAFLILNNLKSICTFIKSIPNEDDLKSNNLFDTLKIIAESVDKKDKLSKIVKTNCNDYSIDKLSLTELKEMHPTIQEHKQNIEDIIDNIMKEHSQNLLNALKKGEKVWLVELNFDMNNSMKGIMAYIIYNNIKGKTSYIVSSISADEFRNKTDFTKLLIYLSSSTLKETELTNIIKVNCNSFSIRKLSEQDLTIQKDNENIDNEIEKNTKTLTKQSAFIEVDKDIVEGVIENIGELVVNLNHLMLIYNELVESDINDINALKMENQMASAQLNATAVLCNSLMDYAMLLRLIPVNELFKKFPRIVRDISKKVDKKVHLVIEGERTRIDQEILDSLEAPLLHMIRNSIDHGIETSEERKALNKPLVGTIILRAVQVKDKVSIEIIDDGKGMDKDKIVKKAISLGFITEENAKTLSEEEIFSFIYRPGFSTSEKVSQISGRGVGMDVVATEIKKMGGKVNIQSEKTKGTKIIIEVPITK